MKPHLFKKSITILFLIIAGIFNLNAEHIVGFNIDFGPCFMTLDEHTENYIHSVIGNTRVMLERTGGTFSTSVLIPNSGFDLSYEYRNETRHFGIKTGLGLLFNNGLDLNFRNKTQEYRYTTIEIPCLLTYTPDFGRKVEVTPFLGTYFSIPVGKLRLNDNNYHLEIDNPLIPGFQLGLNADINLPRKLAIDFGLKYSFDFFKKNFKTGRGKYGVHRQNLSLSAGIKYKIGRNTTKKQ